LTITKIQDGGSKMAAIFLLPVQSGPIYLLVSVRLSV